MTQVLVVLERRSPDGTVRSVSGVVQFEREGLSPVYVPLRVDQQAEVTLPPGTSKVTEHVRGETARPRSVLIPDRSDLVDYRTLVPVDPATTTPTAKPEAAWWVAIQGFVRKVGPLTQAQYDALPAPQRADPGVLYLIRP